MDLDTLIVEACKARAKYGNLRVVVPGTINWLDGCYLAEKFATHTVTRPIPPVNRDDIFPPVGETVIYLD